MAKLTQHGRGVPLDVANEINERLGQAIQQVSMSTRDCDQVIPPERVAFDQLVEALQMLLEATMDGSVTVRISTQEIEP